MNEWRNPIAVAVKAVVKAAVAAKAAAAGRARQETLLVAGELMPLPKARVSDPSRPVVCGELFKCDSEPEEVPRQKLSGHFSFYSKDDFGGDGISEKTAAPFL